MLNNVRCRKGHNSYSLASDSPGSQTQEGLGGAREFEFLTSSQGLLLVRRSHFEEHCCLKKKRLYFS